MAEYEIELRCKHCGKPISILHPSRWAYKVSNGHGGYKYFCTWKCLRADEKENEKPEQAEEPEEKDGRNNRLEVLEELLEAVKGGKDAYDFLEQLGYTDPKDTLRRLRITAKKEAPKMYAKMEKAGLMDMRKGRSGKGADNVNKLTREQKEKAVNIALEGGDYLDHLKKCGAKNPSAAWWYIKKTLAKSNPTLLAQVMKKTGEIEEIKAPEKPKGPVVEKADKLPTERTVNDITEIYDVEQAFKQEEVGTKSVKVDMGMIPQQDKEAEKFAARLQEGIDILAEAAEKVNFPEIMDRLKTFGDSVAGFRVTAINGEFGEYNVTKNPHWFEFDSLDNKTRISMRQEDLGAFINELIRAANFLGVSVG